MLVQVIQKALEGSEQTRNTVYFMLQEDLSRRSGSQPGDIWPFLETCHKQGVATRL